MWRTIALDPSARAHTTGARGEVGLLGDAFDHLVGDTLTLASAEAVQLTEPKTIDLQDFFQDLRRDLPLFGDRDFRFHAVDGSSPSRDYGGSGLGLAIASAIIGAHRGRVSAESAPRRDATLWIELPGYRPARRRCAERRQLIET
jgi:hypothetical protein